MDLFFGEREAQILLGGHMTEKIHLNQGVPQGDIISLFIFILIVEILLLKINYTTHLTGIKFAKMESRSETYADDTTIILQRTKKKLIFAKQVCNTNKMRKSMHEALEGQFPQTTYYAWGAWRLSSQN